MKRNATLIGVLIALSGCAQPSSPVADPTPTARCAGAQMTAMESDAREQLDGHIPTWLPEGFYLAVVERWGDSEFWRPGASALWFDTECRRVMVSISISREPLGMGPPRNPSIGQWVKVGDNPCRDHKPRGTSCLEYRAAVDTYEKRDALHPYAFIAAYAADVIPADMERIVKSISL